MRSIKSLCPIPGGKHWRKYDVLNPGSSPNIVEPFMGGASRSLRYSDRPGLGEINPAMRQIALAGTSAKRRNAFVQQYNATRHRFLIGVDLDVLLSFHGKEQAQKLVKQRISEVYDSLKERWNVLADECFKAILAGDDIAGCYAFLQRACFGNVMRLCPRGTHFNVSWHIDKLAGAIAFDPEGWSNALSGWCPQVFSSWSQAINAVKAPSKTYCLLDPPYWTDGTAKMTPCYPGHSIGTKGSHEETYELAVMPLINAMQRRFPLIHLCNYRMSRLERDAARIASEHGYDAQIVYLGQCNALGNSAGRFKHGQRIDLRPKPIEVIYEFRPAQQLGLF